MEASEIIKSFCAKVGIGFEPDADGTVNLEVDGATVTINDTPVTSVGQTITVTVGS